MYSFCRPTLSVWRCSRWCCCSIRNCCWCHFTSTDTVTNISLLWNEWRHSLCKLHTYLCRVIHKEPMHDMLFSFYVTANIAYNFVKILLSTSATSLFAVHICRWTQMEFFLSTSVSDTPFQWNSPHLIQLQRFLHTGKILTHHEVDVSIIAIQLTSPC